MIKSNRIRDSEGIAEATWLSGKGIYRRLCRVFRHSLGCKVRLPIAIRAADRAVARA